MQMMFEEKNGKSQEEAGKFAFSSVRQV